MTSTVTTRSGITGSIRLLAVVDFEETGVAEPEFDLRYLPGNSRTTALTIAVVDGYERHCGTRLDIERVMAWHVRPCSATRSGERRPALRSPAEARRAAGWTTLPTRFSSFGLLTGRTRRR